MGLLDITNGHINELINSEKELSKYRLKICKQCPLYKQTVLGPICNPKLYINKHNEISIIKQPGFVKGCNCRLNAKTRLKYSKCIINKW